MSLLVLLTLIHAGVPIDPAIPSSTWSALNLESIQAEPGRSRDVILDSLRSAEPDVAACLRASPITLQANVTMTIEASGLVSRVDASAETNLAACLKARLVAVRFEAADVKQTVKITLKPEPKGFLGLLDKEIIRRVVREHASQIRYCYERELTRTPGIGGKIKMKWVIAADGTVTQAVVESDAMGNVGVTTCLIDKIRTWTFPKPKGGGIVIVSYPFVFNQSG
jgi:hypothetical protein